MYVYIYIERERERERRVGGREKRWERRREGGKTGGERGDGVAVSSMHQSVETVCHCVYH